MVYVNEVFKTIQGEGKYTGLPHIFIRFQGCSLQCGYCDTKHTWEKKKGIKMEISSIITEVNKLNNLGNIKHILITGGSPEEQMNELVELSKLLLDFNYHVSIECAGHISMKNEVFTHCYLIMDYKMPSAKTKVKTNISNINITLDEHDIKLVVGDDGDIEIAKNLIEHNKDFHFIVSPMFDDEFKIVKTLDMKKVEDLIMDNTNVKLGIQIHKMVGVR